MLTQKEIFDYLFFKIEAKVLIAKFIQNFDYTLDPTQSFNGVAIG